MPSSAIAARSSAASSGQLGRNNNLVVLANIFSLRFLGPPFAEQSDSPVTFARLRGIEQGERGKKKGRRVDPSPCSKVETTFSDFRVILLDNPSSIVRNLFCGHCHHIDRHIFAAEFAGVESHAACNQRKQGVILAKADIACTWIHLGPRAGG